MANATPAQQTSIVDLYIALFNRAPDADGFAFWTKALADGVPLSSITAAFFISPESTALYPASQTSGQFVDSFYQTVFGRAPDTNGRAFWISALEAAGGAQSGDARADVVAKIVAIVNTQLTTKPDGLSDQEFAQTVQDRGIFAKKTVAGLDFAINKNSNDLNAAKQVLVDAVEVPPVTPPTVPTTPEVPTGPPVPQGVVFALTVGDDAFTGSAGKDTFNAPILENSSTSTLSSSDVLDGGAGTDTLNAGLSFSNTVSPTLRNIEIINIKSLGYGTLNLVNASGVERAGFDGSPGWGTISNVGNAALSVANQNQGAQFTGSTAQTLSLLLTNVGTDLESHSRGIDVLINAAVDGNVASTAFNIDVNNARATLYRGEGDGGATTMTVRATGTNMLALSGNEANTLKNLTVTGSGSVDFSKQALSALTMFSGGAGDDSLSLAGPLAANASFNGGTGRDTIGLTGEAYGGWVADAGSADRASITGFEILKITDALQNGMVIDVSKIPGATSFVAGGGFGGGFVAGVVQVKGLGANASVEIQGGAQFISPTSLELAHAAMPTSNDVLTLVLNATYVENNDADADLRSNTVTVAVQDIKTVHVVSTGTSNSSSASSALDGVNNSLDLNASSMTALTVTGDQAFTFFSHSSQDALTTIDASALEAGATINLESGVESKLTIKGSLTHANTLTGNANDDTITGGAGDDVIRGMDGANTLTGGAGNDTFIYRVGMESSDIITDFQPNIGDAQSGRNGDVLQFEVTDYDMYMRPVLVQNVGNQADAFDFLNLSRDAVNPHFAAAFDMSDQVLYVDLSGDGVADMSVTLTGVPSITASAFEFSFLET